MQVGARQIEAELGAQAGEESADVVAGLGGHVGDVVDGTTGQLGESLRAGLVAVVDDKAGTVLAAGEPLPPSMFGRLVQQQLNPLVAQSQPRREQHPARQVELGQLVVEAGQIVVGELEIGRASCGKEETAMRATSREYSTQRCHV